MNIVKVYTVESYDAPICPKQAFIDYLPQQAMQEPLRYLPCAEGFIDTYIGIKQLPIKEYRWANGRRVFAAMSDELREIIGIEVDEIEGLKKRLLNEKTNHNTVQTGYFRLEEELNKLYEMTFWQRLKWAFKKGR